MRGNELMKTIEQYKEEIGRATSSAELNKIAYEAYQEDTSPADDNFIFGKPAKRISDIVLNMCLNREKSISAHSHRA